MCQAQWLGFRRELRKRGTSSADALPVVESVEGFKVDIAKALWEPPRSSVFGRCAYDGGRTAEAYTRIYIRDGHQSNIARRVGVIWSRPVSDRTGTS